MAIEGMKIRPVASYGCSRALTSMDKAFEDKVKAFRVVLHKHGFKRTAEHYYPQQFGNSVVEFSSKSLRLKFVSDRGAFGEYVSPSFAPDNEFLLQVALEYLDPLYQYTKNNESKVAQALDEHFEALQRLFAREEFARREADLNTFAEWKFDQRHLKGAGLKNPSASDAEEKE